MFVKRLIAQLTLVSILGLGIGSIAFGRGMPGPAKHSICVTQQYCLCVTDSLRALIKKKAAQFRVEIDQAHRKGRMAIYLSVPLTSAAGGYFPLNAEIAHNISQKLLKRFGAEAVWVLNPATPAADLPRNASQADYMYLWSSVLYGAEKSGDGVDLVYFAGPDDFGRFFHLDGSDDLGKLSAYFDNREKTDRQFAEMVASGKLSKAAFLSYYEFRASVAFSAGSHDEWNLVSLINEERRQSGAGIVRQVPVLFDGGAIAPPLYEASVTPGDTGVCRQ